MKRQLAHKEYMESITYRTIYILAGYRRIAELTKEEFAKGVQVSSSMICQIESGKKEVSKETLNRMIETISAHFGYDKEAFTTCLEEQAARLELMNNNQENNQRYNNLAFVSCVCNITKNLLRK